jgi:hypothetical protein
MFLTSSPHGAESWCALPTPVSSVTCSSVDLFAHYLRGCSIIGYSSPSVPPLCRCTRLEAARRGTQDDASLPKEGPFSGSLRRIQQPYLSCAVLWPTIRSLDKRSEDALYKGLPRRKWCMCFYHLPFLYMLYCTDEVGALSIPNFDIFAQGDFVSESKTGIGKKERKKTSGLPSR